ncbi:hypothetical protein BYT27DRAFT_7217353 [Phlegmacium glaucopus]|nr:hypothetical protein BYT27DRAFT_7217353 [Phlegmacium glaucopus]
MHKEDIVRLLRQVYERQDTQGVEQVFQFRLFIGQGKQSFHALYPNKGSESQAQQSQGGGKRSKGKGIPRTGQVKPAGVPGPGRTPAARSSQAQPAVGIAPAQSQNSTTGHHAVPTTTAVGTTEQSHTLSPPASPARLPTPPLPSAQSLTQQETTMATGPVDAATSPETTAIMEMAVPTTATQQDGPAAEETRVTSIPTRGRKNRPVPSRATWAATASKQAGQEPRDIIAAQSNATPSTLMSGRTKRLGDTQKKAPATSKEGKGEEEQGRVNRSQMKQRAETRQTRAAAAGTNSQGVATRTRASQGKQNLTDGLRSTEITCHCSTACLINEQ